MPTLGRPAAISVQTGMRVGASGCTDGGRVAAILEHGATGTLYALTAAHVVPIGSDAVGPRGEQIGAAHSIGRTESTMGQSIIDALSLIRIDPRVRVEAYVREAIQPLGDAYDAFGREVFALVDNITRAGCLTELEAHVRLQLKTGTIIDYVGAAVVTYSDIDPPFAEPGFSGASVIDQAGALIGVVIGGGPGRCYIAPVQALRSEYRWASSQAVSRHNLACDQLLAASQSSSPTRDEGGRWAATDTFLARLSHTSPGYKVSQLRRIA